MFESDEVSVPEGSALSGTVGESTTDSLVQLMKRKNAAKSETNFNDGFVIALSNVTNLRCFRPRFKG